MSVLPNITYQFLVVLLWFYAYGMIGMYVFHNVFVASNPKLIGTDYHTLQYFTIVSFEDLISSLLTLFHLSIVNNWNITLKGAMAATNSWSCIYFLLFYVTTVVIVMNLFVATVLDAFSTEIEKRQSEAMEKKRAAQATVDAAQQDPQQTDDSLTQEFVPKNIEHTFYPKLQQYKN